jgi:CRISPR-associated protein Cas6
LPADQNHRLYAAICRKLPQLHGLERLAIDTIAGIPDKQGKFALTSGSRLLMRLPVDAIAQVYSLSGQTFGVGSLKSKMPIAF